MTRPLRACVPAAVVVELTHLATLYHDDVMDEALLRRGAPSANARWDNTVAILTGRLPLRSRVGHPGRPRARRPYASRPARSSDWSRARSARRSGRREGADPVEHYLSVVADKTGSLIATSGRFGAHAVRCRRRRGRDADRATASASASRSSSPTTCSTCRPRPSESGKTPGTDLREGVPTLPVLHVRRSDDPADDRLRQLLDGPLVDDAAHAEALALLRAHPAMETARTEVRRCADEARDLLRQLPDGPARARPSSRCAMSSSSAPADADKAPGTANPGRDGCELRHRLRSAGGDGLGVGPRGLTYPLPVAQGCRW